LAQIASPIYNHRTNHAAVGHFAKGLPMAIRETGQLVEYTNQESRSWNVILVSCALVGLVLTSLSGCQLMYDLRIPGSEYYVSGSGDQARNAQWREKFRSDGDPEALRKLLANNLENGMPLKQVNDVLGQPGVREFDDERFRVNSVVYQSGDVAYRWGPDRNGRSVILFFREDRLVGFDASEFR
jgi:hypothetical protein